MGVEYNTKDNYYHIYGASQDSEHFYEMVDWCDKNKWSGWWAHQFPFITFEKEKDYMLFLLRWA